MVEASMNNSEKRKKLREYLASDSCIQPASVFDPISSRIASDLGFDIGILGGSVASAVILGAPDLNLITSTELAGQVSRITNASDISLIVDGDNGYGNALNVMRTVRELENAGASAITVEDTVLPATYGNKQGEYLLSSDEMVKKLEAAIHGKKDPETIIIGRSHAINATSISDAMERVRNYQQANVDAIFLTGIKTTDQLEQITSICQLPLMLGYTPPELDNETLSEYQVKIVLRGHTAFTQSIAAIHNEYQSQLGRNGKPNSVSSKPVGEIFSEALNTEEYILWQSRFLQM